MYQLIKISSFLRTIVATATFIQLQIRTRGFSTNSKKSREFVTIEPPSSNGPKAKHMLVGVGALISVLLFFFIIILLYKKSNQPGGRVGRAITRTQS